MINVKSRFLSVNNTSKRFLHDIRFIFLVVDRYSNCERLSFFFLSFIVTVTRSRIVFCGTALPTNHIPASQLGQALAFGHQRELG